MKKIILILCVVLLLGGCVDGATKIGLDRLNWSQSLPDDAKTIFSIGVDNVYIYQTGTSIIAKSFDGDIISTGVIGSDDLKILNDSRDYCHSQYPNGATINILNGNYTISTFEFIYNNLTLKLNKGTIIEGNTSLSVYPIREYGFPSYIKNYVNRSMFWAQDVSNIGIVGDGEIDGNGEHINFNTSEMLTRPFIIRFCNVSNFQVGGENEYLKLYNSAMWTQHYLNCTNGIISKQIIDTNKYGTIKEYRYSNLDGVDIDCSDKIIITDLNIVSGDDAIVLKASGPKNCTNITISNCIISTFRAAIKTGTESNSGFQNIAISDIIISDCQTGIGLYTVDGGKTFNIAISNVNINHPQTPLAVRLGDRNRKYDNAIPVTTNSTMHNIVIDNIQISDPISTLYTSYISGYNNSATGRIYSLSLSNFKILRAPGGGTLADSLIQPNELPTNDPNERMFGTLPACSLYVRHVSDSSFKDFIFNSVLTNDDRPRLFLDDVAISHIYGITTNIGASGVGRVFLNNVTRTSITAVSGYSGVMFRINGSVTNDVLLIGNDCSGTLTTLGDEVVPAEVRSAHNPD